MIAKRLLKLGLPITIKKTLEESVKIATIELNDNNCVVVRVHPDNQFYLQDVDLREWRISNIITRIRYYLTPSSNENK